jgi:uncharacterized membrane protein
VALILAAATIVASAIAWYGNNATSGFGLALFVSIMLTAFSVASASVLRIIYKWSNRRQWGFPDTPLPILATVGAHIPLLVFVIINQTIVVNHHKTYVGAAAIGLIGALLWFLHEGLRAKKEYEILKDESEPPHTLA